MNKLLHTFIVLGFLCPSICGQNTNTIAFSSIPVKRNWVSHQKKPNQFLHDFKLVGGLIFLDGESDGEKQPFILDTGAPTLILNKKINSKFKNFGTGISGSFHIEEIEVEKFSFTDQESENIQALYMSLKHIEKIKKRKIGGLIGFDLISQKELFIDYPRQKIGFLSQQNKVFLEGYQLVHSIPFKMVDHFPVILVKINGVTLHLALDTGAEVNVLDKSVLKKLKHTSFDILEKKKLQGTNKKVSTGLNIEVDEVRIGSLTEHFSKFTTMKMSKLTHEGVDDIDGLLGYKFLKGKIISINFKTKRLSIYKSTALDDDQNIASQEGDQ